MKCLLDSYKYRVSHLATEVNFKLRGRKVRCYYSQPTVNFIRNYGFFLHRKIEVMLCLHLFDPQDC